MRHLWLVLTFVGCATGAERDGLLERYGSLVESLGGLFGTGEDMGTTPADFE